MTVLRYWSAPSRVSSLEKTEHLVHHKGGCDSEMSLAYIRQVETSAGCSLFFRYSYSCGMVAAASKTTTNNQQQIKLSVKFVRGQNCFLLNKLTELESEE